MLIFKKRIAIAMITCILTFSALPGVSFAANLQQATPIVSTNNTSPDTENNYVDFLVKKGVSSQDLSKLDVTFQRNLVNQAKANNFTDTQVQQYVKGLLSNTGKDFYEGKLREDGSFDTNNGVMPNIVARNTIKNSNNITNPANSAEPNYYSGSYGTKVNSSDQTGTYYLVQSGTGYNEATAYATLPSLSSIASTDRPYMFFSVNTSPSSVAGDYGVVYTPGIGWEPCINLAVWNGSSYNNYWYNGNVIPSSKNQLYFDVIANASSSPNSVRLRVLNANNFSDVLWDYTVTFSSLINSNYSNLNLYREITMAQHNNGTLNTSDGSSFANAIFKSSYIYSPSGYWDWGVNQTNSAYIEAPTSAQLSTVKVNNYNQWDGENVSIIW